MTTEHNQRKSIEKPLKPSPIVFVPDKSYIDDTGNVIPIDVILVADSEMYRRMQVVLEHWTK